MAPGAVRRAGERPEGRGQGRGEVFSGVGHRG